MNRISFKMLDDEDYDLLISGNKLGFVLDGRINSGGAFIQPGVPIYPAGCFTVNGEAALPSNSSLSSDISDKLDSGLLYEIARCDKILDTYKNSDKVPPQESVEDLIDGGCFLHDYALSCLGEGNMEDAICSSHKAFEIFEYLIEKDLRKEDRDEFILMLTEMKVLRYELIADKETDSNKAREYVTEAIRFVEEESRRSPSLDCVKLDLLCPLYSRLERLGAKK